MIPFTVNAIQTRFYTKNGKPINHNPKKLIPTQELDKIYEENSNLYIFSKESFYPPPVESVKIQFYLKLEK